MSQSKKWTESERKIVMDAYNDYSLSNKEVISKALQQLDRNESAILGQFRILQIGFNKRNKERFPERYIKKERSQWSKEQEAYIKKWWDDDISNKELMKRLMEKFKKSYRQIYDHIWRMELKLSERNTKRTKKVLKNICWDENGKRIKN